MRKTLSLYAAVLILGLVMHSGAEAQTTAFNYQGSLNSGGTPANGNHDFEFALFDSLAAGGQLGSTLTRSSVAVNNGTFSVSLDFGSQFPGANRFLEIRVRSSAGGGFTTLAPRQQINSGPYAIKSISADTAANAANATNATNATNASQLGGVAANQYVLTTDPRLSDARPPTAGSTNYVQNQAAAPQASTNFNISGNGTIGGTLTGNRVDALTQYDILGARAFVSTAFTSSPTFSGGNTFAGLDSGSNNTTGFSNSFFGNFAGQANTVGRQNAFFGFRAGTANTGGVLNSFFGSGAGQLNTGGQTNSFFGASTGSNNTTGSSNSFFGQSAGVFNSTGNSNSFFGSRAGFGNNIGSDNSFFGEGAGLSNGGDDNSFFGRSAGFNNSIGSENSVFGSAADLGSGNLTNATAIGARALVSQSNSLVLGGITGTNSGTDTNVGIGTTSPSEKLHIAANAGNIVVGDSGCSAGLAAIGFGSSLDTCANYAVMGNAADTFLNRPTGGRIFFRESNSNQMTIAPGGNIGIGTITPNDKLDVTGSIRVSILGIAGPTPLCRNASNQISLCSSSGRYKSNINAFRSGLSLIRQLRPVSFNWREGGMLDLGLVAEDVAKVEPLLTTTNEKGEIEGVKYDRIGVVLVNAVQEQQAQIETQQRRAVDQQKVVEGQAATIARQQAEIESLKKAVCALAPTASVCRLSN